MSALRQSILSHALPLIPTHSFSRRALQLSLSALSPSHPDHREPISDSVLDTLYGLGPSAGRALVQQWEEEGIAEMRAQTDVAGAGPSGSGRANVGDVLKKRLEWSAGVGEHLVEAYALLTAPSSSLSVPLPSIPTTLLSSALSGLRLPPTYSPPGSDHPSPSSSSASSPSVGDALSSLLDRAGGRLPLLSFNPLGPLGYAWRIADAAIAVCAPKSVKLGVAKEPVGSGPEYYTSRLSHALGYLLAESHLLQPLPASTTQGTNPHLQSAMASLEGHMGRFDQIAASINGAEGTAGGLANYLQFVERSTAGILRSRGW